MKKKLFNTLLCIAMIFTIFSFNDILILNQFLGGQNHEVLRVYENYRNNTFKLPN